MQIGWVCSWRDRAELVDSDFIKWIWKEERLAPAYFILIIYILFPGICKCNAINRTYQILLAENTYIFSLEKKIQKSYIFCKKMYKPNF